MKWVFSFLLLHIICLWNKHSGIENTSVTEDNFLWLYQVAVSEASKLSALLKTMRTENESLYDQVRSLQDR